MKPKLSKEEIEEIRKNPNKIDWLNLTYVNTLSEDFIEEFQDKLYWFNLVQHQRLSESFIKKHLDKFSAINICWYQVLSENLIREFSKENNERQNFWWAVCCKQKLSKEFIIEFIDKINFAIILKNDLISQDVKDYCRMFI